MEDAMNTSHEHVAHWTVQVQLSDVDGQTHARAELVTGAAASLGAVGTARLSPKDTYDVPEVGYELAAARALAALAEELMKTARADVEGISDLEGR
jgi:hypothetical protein